MNTNVTSHHEVQFYSSDSALLESSARFVSSALKSHNAVIVLATKSYRKGLVQRLAEEGFDVEGAIQHGVFTSVDADEMLATIMLSGAPDRLRFFEGLCGLIESAGKAAKRTSPCGHLCECGGVLCAEGNVNAAIQLEEVGNDLAQSYDVEILCAYPLSAFNEENTEAYERLCAEHTALYSN